MDTLARAVVDWQRSHGRHALPWQGTRDPYRVWLSEIMLQQTQVSTVIPYYAGFLARFPDVAALARAPLDDVLAAWSGLGYYTRARNLHACARAVVDAHGGAFPGDAASLAGLPGIGRSTAAAIAVFAFGAREAILDGNVKRVFCRCFGVEGFPGAPAVERALWAIAERELPARGLRAYTQGLMDLGATVCTRTRPRCEDCPLAGACVARGQGRSASLPAPRPRRATPVRGVRLLVILRGACVLVERRPAPGVWGGLWSLPELPEDASGEPVADAVRRRFGLDARTSVELPAFEHAFTHFRLRATPVCVDVAGAARVADGTQRWLALDEAHAAALPAPVKSLLAGLAGVRAPGAAAGSPAPATAARARRRAPSASASPAPESAGTRTAGSPPSGPTRSRRARAPAG